MLKDSRHRLETLGIDRSASSEQRSYMLDMSMKYQELTSKALKTGYGGDDTFNGRPCLKLATRFVLRNEAFAKDFEKYGHCYNFYTDDQDKNNPKEILEVFTRTVPSHPELEEILNETMSVSSTDEMDIITWLTELYKESRGFELGTFDASILAVIMRQQSSKWEDLSLGYVSDMISITHAYLVQALECICFDQNVREELMSALSEELLRRYSLTLKDARDAVMKERDGTLMTLNHYFNDNLEKR